VRNGRWGTSSLSRFVDLLRKDGVDLVVEGIEEGAHRLVPSGVR
jgi:hypothetical protein